jgi:hypothetical protein
MNKLFLVLPVVGMLAACGTTEKFEKRAEYEDKRQEKYVERTIDKAPKWMTELPESKSAVYANGTGVSRDFSMADEKAKMVAYSKICMAAGGEVDKQSKMFLSDTDDTTIERSEMAIRSMCRGVDISGAETVEIKRISEGSRYRSYALVALPLGEANALATRNERRKAAASGKARSDRAFEEIDANNRR